VTATLPRLLEPLNQIITPALRCGLGNPLPLTGGLVLLEMRGRRSGRLRTVPLSCIDFGPALVVSTVRERSQWVANLLAEPTATVWLRGRRREVRAAVFQRGALRGAVDAPPPRLADPVRTWSQAVPGSVVLLTLTAEAPTPAAAA
jgi:deazaflavin-dependent oxidoreductase (nitroreductase family)